MIQNFRWKSMNSSRICTCEGCESKSFHFCGNDIVGAQKAADIFPEQAKRKCWPKTRLHQARMKDKLHTSLLSGVHLLV